MSKKKFLTGDALTKAIEGNKHILFEYFDGHYAVSLGKNVLDYVDKHYFRSKFIGFDTFPERNNPDRPLIYISNHSGMAFPWDAMIFSVGILKINKFHFSDIVRTLSAPVLSQSNLMNPFLIRDFWKRAGAVDATTLNFETMMQHKQNNIMIYPEGVPGIGKGFNKKYELQRFATSFVRMSIKYQTDIIPVLTINGEYINPYVFSFDFLNRITKKLGIPFIPIGPHTLLLIFFPWLFYFAFPAQLTFVKSKRIKASELTDKAFEELTRQDIEQITEQVKATMQKALTKAVKEHGKRPYRFWELVKHNLKEMHKMPFFFSPGWPLLFAEHERLYQKHKGEPFQMKLNFFSILKIIFKNPGALWFFIPVFGWIPILYKGYKNHQLREDVKSAKMAPFSDISSVES